MRLLFLTVLLLIHTVTSAQDIPTRETDFLNLISMQGAEKATEYYLRYHEDHPDSSLFRRGTINNLGWQTAETRDLEEVIRLIHLNILAYPDHFDPWDSYIEAVLMRGEKEDLETAIRYSVIYMRPEKRTSGKPSTGYITPRHTHPIYYCIP